VLFDFGLVDLAAWLLDDVGARGFVSAVRKFCADDCGFQDIRMANQNGLQLCWRDLPTADFDQLLLPV